MKKITGYLWDYIVTTDKRVLLASVLFIAVAIFSNYFFDLNGKIFHASEWIQYSYWYGLFLAAFSFPYILYSGLGLHQPFRHKRFLILVFLAPLLFSWKMVYDIELSLPVAPLQNIFWNQIIYWPFKLLVITLVLYVVWRSGEKEDTFYGTSFRGFNAKPYLVMLVIMLPLIA